MRPPLSSVALALLLAACAAHPAPAPRTATPQVIVVPTVLPNGRVDIAIQPRYGLGTESRVDVTVVATRGAIAGPIEARILASGMSAEVLVRRLDATPVSVSAGARGTTFLTWDGQDRFGVRVPADAYVLLLEFESRDGENTRIVQATATLHMND